MEIQEFYQACGEILGVEHVGQPFPYEKRTRWNNRNPGRGRYAGKGIIRAFGPNCVHIALHNPKLNGTFFGLQSAMMAVKNAVNDGTTTVINQAKD